MLGRNDRHRLPVIAVTDPVEVAARAEGVSESQRALRHARHRSLEDLRLQALRLVEDDQQVLMMDSSCHLDASEAVNA